MGSPTSDSRVRLAHRVAAQIVAADAGLLQGIWWFGSADRGAPSADLDVLVVVEPVAQRWSPAHNVAERNRLVGAIGRVGAPIDLYVRTVDQVAEARATIGGVEYAAVRGRALWQRPPRRRAIARRSPRQERADVVQDWMERACRLLGYAVRVAPDSPARAGHMAHRAAVAGLGAIVVAHQAALPATHSPLTTWADAARAADPDATPYLRALPRIATPATAHALLCGICTYMRRLPDVDPLAHRCAEYLGVTTEVLARLLPLARRGIADRNPV